jgi:hypothetical protein
MEENLKEKEYKRMFCVSRQYRRPDGRIRLRKRCPGHSGRERPREHSGRGRGETIISGAIAEVHGKDVNLFMKESLKTPELKTCSPAPPRTYCDVPGEIF